MNTAHKRFRDDGSEFRINPVLRVRWLRVYLYIYFFIDNCKSRKFYAPRERVMDMVVEGENNRHVEPR